MKQQLTNDKAARKGMPIARGVLDYFGRAIAEVARVSYAGNQQHNPGQPMHWAREKSTDHADCIARHLIERGGIDDDGMRHSAKLAWRALALLQLELEAGDAVSVAAVPGVVPRVPEGLAGAMPPQQQQETRDWGVWCEYRKVWRLPARGTKQQAEEWGAMNSMCKDCRVARESTPLPGKVGA